MKMSIGTCVLLITLAIALSFWISKGLSKKHPDVLDILGYVGKYGITGILGVFGIILLIFIIKSGISY